MIQFVPLKQLLKMLIRERKNPAFVMMNSTDAEWHSVARLHKIESRQQFTSVPGWVQPISLMWVFPASRSSCPGIQARQWRNLHTPQGIKPTTSMLQGNTLHFCCALVLKQSQFKNKRLFLGKINRTASSFLLSSVIQKRISAPPRSL